MLGWGTGGRFVNSNQHHPRLFPSSWGPEGKGEGRGRTGVKTGSMLREAAFIIPHARGAGPGIRRDRMGRRKGERGSGDGDDGGRIDDDGVHMVVGRFTRLSAAAGVLGSLGHLGRSSKVGACNQMYT